VCRAVKQLVTPLELWQYITVSPDRSGAMAGSISKEQVTFGSCGGIDMKYKHCRGKYHRKEA
jgi:hypothetical protein